MSTSDTSSDVAQNGDTGAPVQSITTSAFPVLPNEDERLAALQSYHILDTAEEKDFDDLTTLAAAICRTPIALVSLVDKDRQWFKSHKGLAAAETPREFSFCAHAIASPEHAMIVPDAKVDSRFAANPLVTGDTNITFYAGVPLVNSEGFALGSLCVIDHHTRELSTDQITSLMVLAKQVIDKLELRRKTNELQQANKQLQDSFDSLQAAHQSLNNSETRFSHLIQQAPVAIAVLRNRELLVESANAEMLRLWGKQISILGTQLRFAMPELEGQPFLGILDNVFATGKSYYGIEAKITLQYGDELKDNFFNFIYRPLKDEANNVTAIMVVATEVTDQVAARNAVNESNERLALALDAGSLGSYDVNIDTGVMLCSEQCKKNFGLPANAVFNFSDLLNSILPEYRTYVTNQVNAAVASNSVYQAEYEIAWPDGSHHWILASGKIKKDNPEIGIRIIGVTANITERKEADKRKDSFLGIVSHELKTPITSLKASLQLLEKLKEEPQNAIFPVLISTAARSTDKINSLVDDLLNMHRFSENQLELKKKYFNVVEMLNYSCNHVRAAAIHELIVEGDTNIMALGDEHRIEQVITNFVNNAVKYAPLSKEIILSVTSNREHVKLAVKDSGPGIAPADMPHLFDRYWRADHAGAGYSGLGLGLYICAEIIQRHNGEIGVDSQPGQGSTFWFTLPLQQ